MTSSTTVTSSKGGTKTKKKKIEGVGGNDATSPNLTPRTKKTKKSKKNDLEKENISVVSCRRYGSARARVRVCARARTGCPAAILSPVDFLIVAARPGLICTETRSDV